MKVKIFNEQITISFSILILLVELDSETKNALSSPHLFEITGLQRAKKQVKIKMVLMMMMMMIMIQLNVFFGFEQTHLSLFRTHAAQKVTS
jgi:hypothetical protein